MYHIQIKYHERKYQGGLCQNEMNILDATKLKLNIDYIEFRVHIARPEEVKCGHHATWVGTNRLQGLLPSCHSQGWRIVCQTVLDDNLRTPLGHELRVCLLLYPQSNQEENELLKHESKQNSVSWVVGLPFSAQDNSERNDPYACNCNILAL